LREKPTNDLQSKLECLEAFPTRSSRR
jgi:hypothetical protein